MEGETGAAHPALNGPSRSCDVKQVPVDYREHSNGILMHESQSGCGAFFLAMYEKPAFQTVSPKNGVGRSSVCIV